MPKNVLFADDSLTIRKVVEMIFATEDISLVSVDNGNDAIALVRQNPTDLVLADVTMPGINGYEVCEAIKADPKTAGIPVVLVSGTYEPYDEARAKAAQADGHLVKPFESQVLLEKVRSLTGILPETSSSPTQPALESASPSFGDPMSAPGVARVTSGPMPRPQVSIPPAPASPMPGAGALGRSPTGSAGSPLGRSAGPSPLPTGLPRAPVAVGLSARTNAPGSHSATPSNRPSPSSPAPLRPQVARPMGAAPTASRPPSVAYPRTVTMPSIPVTGQRAKDPYGLGGAPNAPVSRPYVPSEPSGGGIQEWKAVGGTGSSVSLDAGVPSVAPAAPARSSSDGGEAVLREALSKASREVIEKIAWEVVPQLAETIIREQLERLIKERDSKS